MKQTKLSLLIAAYNSAEYVEECLRAAINQEIGEKFEVIVVDDNSIDDTLQICKRLERTNPKLRVITHRQNLGLVTSRQTALREALGDYVCFLDGDDFFSEFYYADLYKSAKRFELDIACAAFTEHYSNGLLFQYGHSLPTKVLAGSDLDSFKERVEQKLEICKFEPNTYLWTKIFRKQLVEQRIYKVPPQLKVGEDAALFYTCLHDATKIAITASSDYFYRQHPFSIMKNPLSSAEELENILLFRNFFLRELPECEQLNKMLPAAMAISRLQEIAREALSLEFGDGLLTMLEGLNLLLIGKGSWGIAVKRAVETLSPSLEVSHLDLFNDGEATLALALKELHSKNSGAPPLVLVAHQKTEKVNQVASFLKRHDCPIFNLIQPPPIKTVFKILERLTNGAN